MVRVGAVVPTLYNRPELFRECVDRLSDCAHISVVDTRAERDPSITPRELNWSVGRPDNLDRNVSSWWNRGTIHARAFGGGSFTHLAYVNDDAVVPEGWTTYVATEMEKVDAAAGFIQLAPTAEPILRTEPSGNLFFRMTGYAFVLRNDSDLRFDQGLVWWYGDDDMEWQCFKRGGVLALPPLHGRMVDHRHPGESTNASPELNAQAGRDRETFFRKWGRYPH